MKKAANKAQRRERRLRKAEVWAASYNGVHIMQAYKKKFQVDTVDAVDDLYFLGYLSYETAVSTLAEEKNRLQAQIHRIDQLELPEQNALFDDRSDSLDIPPDLSDVVADSFRKAGKNHAYVDGQLRQLNKTFSQLKVKQRQQIHEWLYTEFAAFVDETDKVPNAKDGIKIVDAVYAKIEKAGIWIPYGEVNGYYRRKKTKFYKRYSKQPPS